MIRHPAFLRAYNLFPHRILNAGCALLTRCHWPKPLLRRLIARWEQHGAVDPADFEPVDHANFEQWFLRELKPGKRPLEEGFVSPVDGVVVGAGCIDDDTILQVKGRPTSVSLLANGRHGEDVDTARFAGGEYLTIFLTPDGYHYLHAPAEMQLSSCHYRPGRFFPQNPTALNHIEAIYERNERAVLELTSNTFGSFLLVMVGASLIGAIFVDGKNAIDYVGSDTHFAKGEKLGHFTFGSTIVLVMPPAPIQRAVEIGQRVRMGQTVFRQRTDSDSIQENSGPA